VLEAFALTPSGLMTEWRLGTSVQLRRYPPGDTAGQPLPNPAAGAVWLTSAPANDSESLVYGFTGWAEPPRWYRLDGDKSAEVSFGSRSVPPGLPELEVTDVTVPSHDGVRVPMTILHRKGLALDGSHPVLLNGYGAYGFTTSAYYASENIAWIERGGVLAFVNPRGSGAYGDDWHRAGFKTTKPNTWKDGIACARYLIAQGYGSERTMGIIGGSAGGIFVGRAVTEAPEMFAAAVFAVGFLDAVRAEVSANGATNTAEFGTVRDPAEFRALLEMSTYHAIRNGITYPGVLLVHGLNDPRVDVWHSAKTAARLQAAQAANPKAGPALLRLDAQAGHGIGSTLDQRLELAADIQSFLLWQMGMAALRE
jgi:prolyl oligopeptidase